MLMTALILLAQPGKKPPAPLMKTSIDSVSYILGESTAYNMQSQNFGGLKVNYPIFNKGLSDYKSNKTPILDQGLCNQVLTNYYQLKAAGKPFVSKVSSKPVKSMLKSTLDSLSYALGQSTGTLFSQQGFGDFPFNLSLYNRGMKDILEKKKPLLNDDLANTTINTYYLNMLREKAKVHIEAGRLFAEQNKQRPGVITTASGLQYEVLQQGTGEKPTAADTFVCHYRGTLLDGTEFDASYKRGEPLQMPVTAVIPGWTEGLQLMPVGSKYKFYIPYQLGYGVTGQGAIPGGATLVFEVELLDVKKTRPNPVLEASRNFLEQNKLRPEVKTTASGLQYEVIREGTGPKMAALDTFVCHYRGTLVDGTEFDASYNRGQPLIMPANQVIRGWTEGLQLMPVGSKYKFYIPSDLGYGPRGYGPIPGGAAIIFEVELLEIRPRK